MNTKLLSGPVFYSPMVEALLGGAMQVVKNRQRTVVLGRYHEPESHKVQAWAPHVCVHGDVGNVVVRLGGGSAEGDARRVSVPWLSPMSSVSVLPPVGSHKIGGDESDYLWIVKPGTSALFVCYGKERGWVRVLSTKGYVRDGANNAGDGSGSDG